MSRSLFQSLAIVTSNKVFKVCITGPESSGKSYLSNELSKNLNWKLVLEFAREYIESLNRQYTSKDLLNIAQNQFKAINDSQDSIIDTGVEVVKIWQEFKYKETSKELNSLLQDQNSIIDLYILCKPDIPWEPDPLRENPEQRDELFYLYLDLLDQLDVPHIIVSGSLKERISLSLDKIEQIRNEKAFSSRRLLNILF